MILAETVVEAKRSSELSILRYSEGFSDYQRVLTSQQSLFVQQQRYIISKSNTVSNLVSLYKAMGGDWEGREWSDYIDPETLETMKNRTDWGEMIDLTPVQTETKDKFRKIDW
jgi:hypothetical protein